MNWIYWSLLSAVFAGATAVLAKAGIAGVDSNLATAIRTSVVLVFVWVISYATSRPGAVRNLTSRAWLFLVLSGLATGLSWLCYFRALKKGPVSQVAPIDKLSFVIAMILGIILFKEKVTLLTVVGAFLILSGAM